MYYKYKFCLFLTGTIEPKSVPYLERNNVKEREKDYYESLKQWMKYDLPIVFCENSNFNSIKIDELTKDYSKFQYLKFDSKLSKLGKGHGEAEIFEYAFLNSNILMETEYIAKVTGRYSVLNFNSILRQINKMKDGSTIIFANLSTNFLNLIYADSRFFIFKKEFFWEYLKPNLSYIDEHNKIYFEHILAKSILEMISKFNPLWRFIPEVPIFKGVYGTMNVGYRTDFLYRLKKQFTHKIKFMILFR